MDSARQNEEADWHYTDLQVRAEVSTDAKGRMLVNVPIERVLLDINDGKYSQPIPYDVIGWQWYNDPQAIQPVYFALQDFLDREKFYQEKNAAVRDWGQYGTMHMFTGIRQNSYMRYEPKEVMQGIYSDDMKEIKRTEYKYCPINIPIYNVRWDDQALNQWDYEKADDVIIEEAMTVEKIKITFSWLADFDIDKVQPYAITDPAYWKYNAYPDQWVISYYYNKVTSDWSIILNHSYSIYEWKYYHDGHLPVTAAQHYKRNDSIYGEGKPHRVRAMKWYKKSILQDILDASKMSAGINLIVWDGTEVNGKVGSGINIWTTTGGWANAVQPVPIQTRLADMIAVVNVIDDLIAVDAWENVRAPFTSPKTTLWEIEIMEEKQQTRDRALDQNLNVFMDDVLTKTAKNLTKYMVVQEKKREDIVEEYTDKDGNKKTKTITQEVYPTPVINVRGYKVEKKVQDTKKGKKKTYTFTKDFSEDGFFTLEKSMCKWEFLVKVVTSSTKPSNAIAKNTFLQATQSLDTLANTFRLLGIPIAEDFKQQVNPKDILTKWRQLYEMTNIQPAKTGKDKIDDEINKEMEIAKLIMWMWASWWSQDSNNQMWGVLDPNNPNPDANTEKAMAWGSFENTPWDRTAPVTE